MPKQPRSAQKKPVLDPSLTRPPAGARYVLIATGETIKEAQLPDWIESGYVSADAAEMSLEPVSPDRIYEHCPFTGYTDSQGSELFWGDWCVDLNGNWHQVLWQYGAFRIRVKGNLTNPEIQGFDADLLHNRLVYQNLELVRIGNRWQPEADLKAEALRVMEWRLATLKAE